MESLFQNCTVKLLKSCNLLHGSYFLNCNFGHKHGQWHSKFLFFQYSNEISICAIYVFWIYLPRKSSCKSYPSWLFCYFPMLKQYIYQKSIKQNNKKKPTTIILLVSYLSCLTLFDACKLICYNWYHYEK